MWPTARLPSNPRTCDGSSRGGGPGFLTSWPRARSLLVQASCLLAPQRPPTSLPSYTARPDRRHGHHPEHVTTQTRRSEPACPQGGHAHLGLRKTNLRAYLPARWCGHHPPWGTPAPVRSFYQHLQLSVAWGGQPMLLFSFKSCSGDSNIQSGRESATCQSVDFSKGISGSRHMILSS